MDHNFAVRRAIGYALVVTGVGLVVGGAAVSGYDRYEQARGAREVASIPAVPPLARPSGQPTTMRAALGGAPDVESSTSPAYVGPATSDELADVISARRPGVVALVGPEAQGPGSPDRDRALRVVAPTIELDAKVVESPLVHGEWQVPPFAAGHLAGTAQPLQGGNVGLAGHLQSLARGNVFANLDRLRVGDVVRLDTPRAVVAYRVATVATVSRDDLNVLAQTSHETLTLITCAGTWLPLQRDYSERTVVAADGID
jgi:LPXTG-site transpeptidase (sortase) family protein